MKLWTKICWGGLLLHPVESLGCRAVLFAWSFVEPLWQISFGGSTRGASRGHSPNSALHTSSDCNALCNVTHSKLLCPRLNISGRLKTESLMIHFFHKFTVAVCRWRSLKIDQQIRAYTHHCSYKRAVNETPSLIVILYSSVCNSFHFEN